MSDKVLDLKKKTEIGGPDFRNDTHNQWQESVVTNAEDAKYLIGVLEAMIPLLVENHGDREVFVQIGHRRKTNRGIS